MLFIRADANSIIGSGHIMRCLSIANAAKKAGINCIFISADREAEDVVLSNGFSYICLDSSWNQLDNEIEKLKSLIKSLKIKKLLLDSYYVANNYLNALKEYTNLIYLDDLNKSVYPVDVLINYNIYAEKLDYKQYNLEKTKLLLGCRFVPLREEFQNRNHEIKTDVTNILVTTGGSDIYNVAGNLVEYLNQNSLYHNINFHIVVGSFNRHIDKLNNLSNKYNNIVLHNNVTEMSKLMLECDLAVSAGGSTLYELCSCGIPAISFSLADNQLYGVTEFDKRNLIYYAGDVRRSLDSCIKKIEDRTNKLIKDNKLRRGLSNNMKAIVDGYGAERIIKKIM
jgi:UDP-2,4-diacetamido-2,4,6-trideoxy-beta-L-altropyranose hydrolase